MPGLNALRGALSLAPLASDIPFATLEEAQAHLPELSPGPVRAAALRLLALEVLQDLPAATSLLSSLAQTLHSARPERELVQWLALITGGQAELRSSWGDRVAQAGTPGGPCLEQRLTHEGRSLGSLHLWAEASWQPLLLLSAEFATLVRLRAAAAGAARRRAGERVLEALLAGDSSGAPEHERCTLAASRLGQALPRSERSREAHIQLLDVLCGVGEGYFRERGLKCLTTVRGDKALWLWSSHDTELEGRGLHAALSASTDTDFRLGLSAEQGDPTRAAAALQQAEQALAAVRTPRGAATFSHLDPLQDLLGTPAAQALQAQVRGRLEAADHDGKLEETLRRYLAHAGPLAALAAELHIHVNTLRYRLGRLEDVLGGTLSEPAFAARLYLALAASNAAGR